jgi:hypothetical protein
MHLNQLTTKKVIESLISNNVSVNDKSASEDVKKYENLTIVGFRVCLEGYSRLVMIIKRKKTNSLSFFGLEFLFYFLYFLIIRNTKKKNSRPNIEFLIIRNVCLSSIQLDRLAKIKVRIMRTTAIKILFLNI